MLKDEKKLGRAFRSRGLAPALLLLLLLLLLLVVVLVVWRVVVGREVEEEDGREEEVVGPEWQVRMPPERVKVRRGGPPRSSCSWCCW